MNATQIESWFQLEAVEEAMLHDMELAEKELYETVIQNKPHIRLTLDGSFYSQLPVDYFKGEVNSPIVGAWD